jgi:cyclophilin family peptidyl-prolyl cis-trans isomerase
MIQTGDPLGTGSGDAGYKFKDLPIYVLMQAAF